MEGRVHPGRELGPVGGGEARAPVGGVCAGAGQVGGDDELVGLDEGGDAGKLHAGALADELAAHVVAVPGVDLELDGVQDAGGVAQQEQLGVVALGDEARGAAAGPLDLDDVVPGEPGQDVDLVDGGVGHRRAGVLAGVGLDVAVHGVGHEEGAVGPGGEARPHGPVPGVEAPHEADGEQRPLQCPVGAHDVGGLDGCGSQGLLAQDGQSRLKAGPGQRCVERVGDGDDDRVDLAGGDHLLPAGVDDRAPGLLGEGVRPRGVRVGDRRERGAAHSPGEVAGVVGAHDAGADDSDSQVCQHHSSLNDAGRAPATTERNRLRPR